MGLARNMEIASIAKVLTKWDTNNSCLPLEWARLSIKSHFTVRDRTSWIIIRRRILAMNCLQEVMKAVSQVHWVMFSVSDLAKMLITLDCEEELVSQLKEYAV